MTLDELLSQAEERAAAYEWAEVRRLLTETPALSPGRTDHARIRHLQLRANALWWKPMVHGRLTLRRLGPADADFYKRCFESQWFTWRFKRQQPWRGDLVKALTRLELSSPLDSGAVHWVICLSDGSHAGLASLTSFSAQNSRAEYSIGFPSPPNRIVAAVATLAVYDFAFFGIGLNKLYSYVYSDNTDAFINCERIGLRHEGTLKDHYFLPPGNFVDVHAMGLTKASLLADDRLVGLSKRWLNVDWRKR